MAEEEVRGRNSEPANDPLGLYWKGIFCHLPEQSLSEACCSQGDPHCSTGGQIAVVDDVVAAMVTGCRCSSKSSSSSGHQQVVQEWSCMQQ